MIPFLPSFAGLVAEPGKRLALILGSLLALVLMLLGAAWWGYCSGFSRAEDAAHAAYATVLAEHAQARAEAEAQAREMVENATRRGQDVERKFLAARRTIAAQSAELTRHRILEVSRADVHCSSGPAGPGVEFGPDWVREFNAAFGSPGRDRALPETAPGPHGAAAADPGAYPGPLGGVTPADILAWAKRAGEAWRATRAQLDGLTEWARGR